MNKTLFTTRAIAALRLSLVADALAMPVQWFYNPVDIHTANSATFSNPATSERWINTFR